MVAPCRLGQRAQKGEAIGRIGERIMIGLMDRARFIGGQLELLLLQQQHLRVERGPRLGEFAVDLPPVAERGRGLQHFLRLERLCDIVDLVDRTGGATDIERGEIGIAGDDHQVDLRIERTDAAGGFLAVDSGRHAHVDERDCEPLARLEAFLDRRDTVEPLHLVNAFEIERTARGCRRDGHIHIGIAVTEEFGRHRGERRSARFGRLARTKHLAIRVVHRRLVVHD